MYPPETTEYVNVIYVIGTFIILYINTLIFKYVRRQVFS